MYSTLWLPLETILRGNKLLKTSINGNQSNQQSCITERVKALMLKSCTALCQSTSKSSRTGQPPLTSSMEISCPTLNPCGDRQIIGLGTTSQDQISRTPFETFSTDTWVSRLSLSSQPWTTRTTLSTSMTKARGCWKRSIPKSRRSSRNGLSCSTMTPSLGLRIWSQSNRTMPPWRTCTGYWKSWTTWSRFPSDKTGDHQT